MSSAAQDTIPQMRRRLSAFGRRHSDPFIKNRSRIVVHDLDRCAKEPDNLALQRVLARNVGELEELLRNSPRSVTCPSAGRKVPMVREGDALSVLNRRADRHARAGDGIAAIDAIVPRGMVDRDDVKQDAFLAMFDGTAPDPKSAVKEAMKRYRLEHPSERRQLSFDAPLKGTDTLTLYDVTPAAEPDSTGCIEGEDDE
jgi:hypothetical protein